ncbi:hypothetical protein BZARG_1632 [Bizionia argentinensis JUB59]|uniref:Uncharacterized protein n=1 Tax=Bizionia argentinensis JUB59 TaxID=1046627 RepID=G2EER8_9FLAO|nr:hypothetical protein [Bizionia argentinensis]EGV43072.1 hypothetical protein BZARG_1632 [Bizionia argentinensis JUB59]
MKRLFLFFCFVSIISCKSDKKEEQKTIPIDNTITTNTEIDGKMYFEIIMDAVVLKDDKFHVFYKDFNDGGFSGERVIEALVKGNVNNQQIIFAIPEEIIPNGLRLDFGVNYGQEPIKLNSLKIRFDKREFQFNDGKFEQLFKPNKFVIYGEKDKEIITEPIDGLYDPNFVSINLEDIIFSLMD